MSRPAGVSPGALALLATWTAGAVIAVLTGAAAVVILLAAGAVGGLWALVAGLSPVRRVRVDRVATADVAVAGEALHWHVVARARSPVRWELRVAGAVVATGSSTDGETRIIGVAPCRGMHTSVELRWLSAGRPGLCWWRRRSTHALASPLAVAPLSADDSATVDRRTTAMSLGSAPAGRPGRDQPDGVRAWRDGDEINAVHWPSSLRSGELIMRHRVHDANELWTVRARTGTDDPDHEAGRVRRALEDGMRAGASVAVTVDNEPPVQIASWPEIARWSATFDPRAASPARQRWWRRALRVRANEPKELTRRSRRAIAVAGAAPLVMVLQALGYGPTEMGVVVAASAVGAVVSMHAERWLRAVRPVIGLLVAGVVVATLVDIGRVSSVATSLRFLLPQSLVALVVMHGFECDDRRAGRIAVACSALLAAYAAGVRIDDQLGLWLLVSSAGIAWAITEIARPDRRPLGADDSTVPTRLRGRGAVTAVAGLAVAALATLALLATVPVPRGPAQLTLPSWLQERRPTGGDGALAAPDGSPLLGGASTAGGSSGGTARGSAGSYAGFSPEMDTSARGDLGDEIVLKVRAPSPDFWRGQTFSEFDGRSWTADADVGTLTQGPEHIIRRSVGDVVGSDDTFVQTFYAEVDLPNLVFAATSPQRVLLDAPLWQRPDGALRADVVLPAGSAYTVVSSRSNPTAESLRAEGVLGAHGSPPAYLRLPESTTTRVRALATELAAGSPSTYDTILAIEAWLHANVQYDLDAPVPANGRDAVDDFLFESKRGFCEQIASATAIMLRSLGVPARIATGYVPSDRDEVAGVWISRAKDAHAWVEVHFPGFGWVPFDPTASVPLAGEADRNTIGSELFGALGDVIGGNITVIVGVVVGAGAFIAIARFARLLVARRRRGRWGRLQDRFVVAAVRRGAPPAASNTELASAFDDPGASAIAALLDSAAFSATWTDDDDTFARAVAALGELEPVGSRRHR
jgi:protein-glutamine gamma-glutamyltransferase